MSKSRSYHILLVTFLFYTTIHSLEFLLIGDYGWTPDMTDPNLNFDAINQYASEGNNFDFIMTTGDNIYANQSNESYPTMEEADMVMKLFSTRQYLKDKEIWPVRGNHDCYAVDSMFEVNLSKKYPNWKMPALYHEKLYDLGHGKKLGVLYVDSCLAICSTY